MVYIAPTLLYSLQDGKTDRQRHMMRNVSTLMDLSTQCSYNEQIHLHVGKTYYCTGNGKYKLSCKNNKISETFINGQ